MLRDAQNTFSEAQAITTSAASVNQIDLGPVTNAGNARGNDDTKIALSVVQAFTAAGAATLTVQVIDADNAAMTGARVIEQSGPIAIADLAIGGDIPYKPSIPVNCRRYVGLNYVVATGPFTAGQLTAGVVAARQTQR